MEKKSLIYVAGHTGFIGSALVRSLKDSGFKNLILKTHKQLDLTDQEATERFFAKYRPEYVFLLAAKVGGILANSTYPADFIFQNIAIQTNVLYAAFTYKVKKLLFLGSACMYPKFCCQPMRPEYILAGPIESTNEPFALAKICGLKMCEAYNKQYKTKFICAIPATVYGHGDHYDENGHVVAGLLEKAYRAKINPTKNDLKVWGTGKPKREFLFIDDAVNACIFLMNNYNEAEPINIGTNEEISIKELARKIRNTLNLKGEILFEREKPDGIPRRILDSSKIYSLGWRPKVFLDTGLKITCEWYKKRNYESQLR